MHRLRGSPLYVLIMLLSYWSFTHSLNCSLPKISRPLCCSLTPWTIDKTCNDSSRAWKLNFKALNMYSSQFYSKTVQPKKGRSIKQFPSFFGGHVEYFPTNFFILFKNFFQSTCILESFNFLENIFSPNCSSLIPKPFRHLHWNFYFSSYPLLFTLTRVEPPSSSSFDPLLHSHIQLLLWISLSSITTFHSHCPSSHLLSSHLLDLGFKHLQTLLAPILCKIWYNGAYSGWQSFQSLHLSFQNPNFSRLHSA